MRDQSSRYNPRIEKRDRSNIKGALRRAFARSTLHEEILFRVAIEHSDPKRPRCKRWGYCEICGEVTPMWKITVDHIDPIIPVDRTFEEMPLDEVVSRMWCPLDRLQALCELCHGSKTQVEAAHREAFKAQRKIAA